MRPHVGLFVMAVMLLLLGSSPSLAEATVEDGAEATPGMTSKSLEEESYLYRLSVQDLRTMLHERSGGQLDVSSINSKAELVREVMRFEDAPSAKVEAEKKAAEGPRASRRNSGVRQRQSLQRDEEAPSPVKQRRAPGAPSPIITHALRLEVRYCAARGYDKSWNKLLEVMELPDGWEVRAETVPYPVPPLYQTLAKICDVSFFVVLALSVVGQNLTFIPARLRDLMARRRMLVISTAMMLRTMSSFLVQTGAFEVMMDGKLVYSALQSGKLPTAEILRDAIVTAAS